MAQVVYDQHPLGDYLKDEAGEQALSMTMPGGDQLLTDSERSIETEGLQDVFEPLVSVLRRLSHTIMHLSRQTAHREFAERFTHAIILSPLLSNTSPSSSPPNTSTIPHHPITLPTDESDLASSVDPVHAWPLAAGVLVLAVFVTSGFTAACIIALIAGLAHVTDIAPEHHARQFIATACGKLRSSGWLSELEDDPAPMMLAALDRCVQATSAWDSVVSEAVGLLETEERTLFYSSSPPAPSAATSALRVALSSELNAATNTTDTLRGLFAPLTQPVALAPLTAMYAPPTSPPPVRVRSHARYASIGPGPRTLDGSPSPNPNTPGSKRSTWGPGIGGGGGGGKFSTGGNYGTLGLGRRRTSASMRRSRLATPDRAMDVPLPVDEDEDAGSPKVVSDIGEDSERLAPLPQFGSDSEAVTTPRTPPRRNRTPNTTFGSAALSSLRRVSHNQIQTTSLTAIRHSLTVARSSRRHTAAHLMALRFADGDGEYWEDVKSVMGLLSAGMEDAASRLGAAVESVQGNGLGDSSFGSESGLAPGAVLTPLSAGFAPTATPKERFAMHVDELVGAAGRAKELALSLSTLSLDVSSPDSDAQLEAVRRELGTALRQLERARAVLRQQHQRTRREEEDIDIDSDVPGLDGSPSSPASSEKGEELTPLDAMHHSNADILRRDSLGRDTLLTRSTIESSNVRSDDASAYLLLGTSAQHLPPPGIEQVFEADSDDLINVGGVGGGKRPRSTMSRAERIAAARAKRELKPASSSGGGENWGPGGDVVQELKAVISEVGVRRRRAASDAQRLGVPPSLDLSSTRVLGPSVEVDEVREDQS
ncbi:hypothetical protein FRC12_015203 [Ceratobasidium sp. 428]|nr:hypothetical protein FRC12_015203 [Ceratobasidium sp. 428]